MKKVIAPGLSPNTQQEDVVLACQGIFPVWRYKKGPAVAIIERWFRDYLAVSHAISFKNARSALYAIMHCLDIGKNDEVLLQAFTCVVVPNAVIATGAKPVFVDCTSDYTLDPKDIERKITKNTKAIIVQHTFGIAANMNEIMTIAKKNNILVIEDVAHSIGSTYEKKKLGTFGVASIFSFGRDKAFSSVFGGIAVTKDKALGKKLRLYQRQRNFPSFFWIFQQLLHPVIFSVVLQTYTMASLGKVIVVIAQRLHLVSFPVSSNEKRGRFFPQDVQKMPNALAVLALLQVKKIIQYNTRRKEIVAKYNEVCPLLGLTPMPASTPLLRFPILVTKPALLKNYCRKQGIYLGDWYANVVDPKESNFKAIGYVRGSCKDAEQLAEKIINLPTYPTMTDNDVSRVVLALQTYVTNQRNTK